jgi:hypothetical protein
VGSGVLCWIRAKTISGESKHSEQSRQSNREWLAVRRQGGSECMFYILSSQIQYSPGNMEIFNIICFNYTAQKVFTLSYNVYKISCFFLLN